MIAHRLKSIVACTSCVSNSKCLRGSPAEAARALSEFVATKGIEPGHANEVKAKIKAKALQEVTDMYDEKRKDANRSKVSGLGADKEV